MVYCVVKDCSNRSSRKSILQQAKETEKNQNISFHRLPKEEDLKQKWLKILKLSESDIKKPDTSVCSEHFNEDSFSKTQLGHKSLKKNTLPIPIKVPYFKEANIADFDVDEKTTSEKTEFKELDEQVCRLCPSDEFLSDLYHPRNSEIRKIINLFINIDDESSNLPKYICEVCEHIVQSIIEFRDKCKERDNELRESDSKNLIFKIEDRRQSTEEETLEILPIEVLIIKDEVPDESDSLIEYLDDNLEEEFPVLEEEEKTVSKKPKPKRDRSKRHFPCLLCKNIYSNWSELNEHKKVDHLQCPVCLKNFKNYLLMAHHKRNVHAGETNCHICGKVILNRTRLLRHIRSVHNNERNHKCEICGIAFFFKSKLVIHMLTHNGSNTEICDFENCGKMFKSIYNLQRHKQIHFPRSVTTTTNSSTKPNPNPIKKPKISKTIICHYCGKVLKTNVGLEFHLRVHRNEKPFDCTDCDKKFRDKKLLEHHQRIHKNLRPYKCDLCSKSFCVMAVLKNHKISIHSTEMKHECHICGKRTKIKSNLTLHMKTHGIGKKEKYD